MVTRPRRDDLAGDYSAAVEPSVLAFFRLLADAPDGDTVAHSLCFGLLAPYQAELVTIHMADERRESLDLVGQWGLERELAHLYARMPVDLPSPTADVLSSGAELFVSFRQVAAEYPIMAAYLKAHPSQARSQAAYLPLRHRGVPVGVLGLRFHQPVQRTWQLRQVLDAALSGITLWGVAHASAARGTAEGRRRQRELRISDRQRQVLALVREGRTNADIARRLGYSEVTIKADLTALYKLLGAKGREELVERAGKAGL